MIAPRSQVELLGVSQIKESIPSRHISKLFDSFLASLPLELFQYLDSEDKWKHRLVFQLPLPILGTVCCLEIELYFVCADLSPSSHGLNHPKQTNGFGMITPPM